MSKYVEEIKDLNEFKMRKFSEENDLKKKQKKLRKVNETEAKVEVAKVYLEVDTDENKNDPAPKIDETITTSIHVSNIFDIFSVEPSSDDIDIAEEDNEYANKAENLIDDNKRIIEDTLDKIRSKLREDENQEQAG